MRISDWSSDVCSSDLFISRLWRPRTQATVELVLYFLFFFPGILALIFAGWRYSSRSWRYLEVSSFSPANIPIYQFKTIIVAAGVLVLLQGIAQAMRCVVRSEEHTSELQSLMRNSYAVFCLKKKNITDMQII